MHRCVMKHSGILTSQSLGGYAGITFLCVWTFSNKILEESTKPWATHGNSDSVSWWWGLGMFWALQGILMSQVCWGPCGIGWFSSNLDTHRKPLEILSNAGSDPAGLEWGLSLHFSQAPRWCWGCPCLDHTLGKKEERTLPCSLHLRSPVGLSLGFTLESSG